MSDVSLTLISWLFILYAPLETTKEQNRYFVMDIERPSAIQIKSSAAPQWFSVNALKVLAAIFRILFSTFCFQFVGEK